LDTTSLYTKLTNPETYRITIKDTLIGELNDYLKDKDDNYRLLFLVDEVSQYIGNNKELLLNFQNIVERISEDCNNKVWVACTAQQTLDEVSNAVDSRDPGDEFGKILGRFDTRISLESADASYITQRRVLDKNSDGIKALQDVYSNNVDAIENQFKMHHELYKGYQKEDDFIMSYPFVPYQFKLISDVFASFQNLQFVIKEVKDNERSILSITHFTAKQNAGKDVGDFIPFDAFFNNQFSTNLTQRGRRAIENALKLPSVEKDEFAQRVVKNLFMISNLSDAARMTFPPNIDNLTILLMNSIDQNKLELQNKTKAVLEKLIEDSIVREERGNYFFFNEDEMDLTNLIKGTVPNYEDRLVNLDNFIRPMLRVDQKYRYGQNDFKVSYEIDDKSFLRGGNIKVLVSVNDKSDIQQRALSNTQETLQICINEWYANDEILKKDFDWYCKNIKYFKDNSDSISGERSKTLETFKSRNKDLEDKIRNRFIDKFPETNFLSGTTIINADEINGSKANDRYKNVLEKHLSIVYKHHNLSADYATTANDLRKFTKSTQTTAFNDLTPAEQKVDELITNNGGAMNVVDIIRKFDVAPFGWKDLAVIHMLVELNKKKKREFEYKHQQRYSIADFVEKAIVTSERSSCIVKEGEEIPQTDIDEAILNYRNIFNVDLKHTTDGNLLFDQIVANLEKVNAKYKDLESEYYGKYPFGNHFHDLFNKLDTWIKMRDPKRLYKTLHEDQDDAKLLFDKCKSLTDFISRTLDQYKAIKRFVNDNKENFRSLEPTDQEKADRIISFFENDDPTKEFRHIKKAFDELKLALNDLLNSLKEKVIAAYEKAFKEIEEEAKKLKITEAHVYADKNYTLNKIGKINSITSLQLELKNVEDFRREEISKLYDYAHKYSEKDKGASKVGEPEEFYITRIATTIQNEEELNAYIEKVKKQMLELLKNNKTIIIK